jgi:hypothetical protein
MRSSALQYSRSLTDLISQQQRVAQSGQLIARLSGGLGSAAEQAAFTAEAQQRGQLAGSALSGDLGAIRLLREQGILSRGPASDMQRMAATTMGVAGGRFDPDALDAGDRQLLEGLRRQSESRVAERQGLEAIAVAREATAGAREAAGSSVVAPRRSGGGGSNAGAGDTAGAQRAAAANRAAIEAGKAQNDAMRAAELEAQRSMVAAELEIKAERERREEERHARQLERFAEWRAASQETTDAIVAFSDKSYGSLSQVLQAYDELSRTSRDAAREVRSSGQLMARGTVAIGNQIADVVGGTMVDAFAMAVDAWVSGAKSFEEAAADMVRGVLRALVTEAIVQGVVELARAIADLASYRYDSAALHFAAAGAWAAVGVVAGTAGAAIGAFGGGGGGGKASSASSGQSPRELGAQSTRERESGPITIQVFPGGLVTRGEVAAGVTDALNYSIRNGGRLDSRAMR